MSRKKAKLMTSILALSLFINIIPNNTFATEINVDEEFIEKITTENNDIDNSNVNLEETEKELEESNNNESQEVINENLITENENEVVKDSGFNLETENEEIEVETESETLKENEVDDEVENKNTENADIENTDVDLEQENENGNDNKENDLKKPSWYDTQTSETENQWTDSSINKDTNLYESSKHDDKVWLQFAITNEYNFNKYGPTILSDSKDINWGEYSEWDGYNEAWDYEYDLNRRDEEIKEDIISSIMWRNAYDFVYGDNDKTEYNNAMESLIKNALIDDAMKEQYESDEHKGEQSFEEWCREYYYYDDMAVYEYYLKQNNIDEKKDLLDAYDKWLNNEGNDDIIENAYYQWFYWYFDDKWENELSSLYKESWLKENNQPLMYKHDGTSLPIYEVRDKTWVRVSADDEPELWINVANASDGYGYACYVQGTYEVINNHRNYYIKGNYVIEDGGAQITKDPIIDYIDEDDVTTSLDEGSSVKVIGWTTYQDGVQYQIEYEDNGETKIGWTPYYNVKWDELNNDIQPIFITNVWDDDGNDVTAIDLGNEVKVIGYEYNRWNTWKMYCHIEYEDINGNIKTGWILPDDLYLIEVANEPYNEAEESIQEQLDKLGDGELLYTGQFGDQSSIYALLHESSTYTDPLMTVNLYELKDKDGKVFYVYCADHYVAATEGVTYTKIDIDEQNSIKDNRFDAETLAHLNVIVQNGYFQIDKDSRNFDKIKEALSNTEYADYITEGIALTATQCAIWYYTHPFGLINTDTSSDNWMELIGYCYGGGAQTLSDNEKGALNAVLNYLVDIDTTNEQTLDVDVSVTKIENMGNVQSMARSISYNTNVVFTIATMPSGFKNEDLSVTVYVDGLIDKTINLSQLKQNENGDYIISDVNLGDEQRVDIKIDGSITEEKTKEESSVYIFAAQQGTDKSQTFIGRNEEPKTVNIMSVTNAIGQDSKMFTLEEFPVLPIVSESPSPSPSNEPEVSESPQPSDSPKPSESPVVSESPSPSPSVEPSDSPEPSNKPSETPIVSESPSPSPSNTPEVSESPQPSDSPKPSESPVVSESPSPSPSVEPSEEPSVSPSVGPSDSPEPSDKPSETPIVSESPSPSSSNTPEVSESPIITPTHNTETEVRTGDYYTAIIIFISIGLSIGGCGFYLLKKKRNK